MALARAALLLAVVALTLPPVCSADEPASRDEGTPPARDEAFETNVAAVLVRNCLRCHNASEASGGLDLSRREKLLAGGDSGAVIEPGDPEASYLLDRVSDGSMPPEGKASPLEEAEIAGLKTWIK